MITSNPISSTDIWAGFDWAIADEDKAAELIARVAIGQAQHVAKVLNSIKCVAYSPAPSVKNGAIGLLTAKSAEDPYHRDGWLFQILTWFAAHKHRPNTLKSPPHMIHAHKGFDGLELILVTDSENVDSVLISEQKATNDPRGKITSQVWPEFKSLESGKRDNELAAEVTTLLARNGNVDADEAISKILWSNSRSYCVSVTVDDKNNSKAGRDKLFKGYDHTIPNGDASQRSAETFYKQDMREWMEQLAQKAIKVVNDMEEKNV